MQSYQRLEQPEEHNRFYVPPVPQAPQQLPQQQQIPQPQQQYYQPHPSPYVQQHQQQPPQYGQYQPASYQQYGAPPPQQGGSYVAAPIQQQVPYGSVAYVQQAAHPGVAGHVVRGMWTDSLFDCFDSGVICLLSLFFPCVRWSMTISRAKYLTLPVALLLFALPYVVVQGCYTYLSIAYPDTYGTDANPTYDGVYIALMSVMSFCQVLGVVIGAYYRNKIRKDYQIPGNAVEDCAMHLCCQCCAIAQEARHVDRDYGILV